MLAQEKRIVSESLAWSKTLDLEIGLHRRGPAVEDQDAGIEYLVELRGSRPDSAADVRPEQGLARFSLIDLRQKENDARAYGQLLTDSLFADPKVKEAFIAAQASAESIQAALRIRLMVADDAHELHNLHWETLRHPQEDTPLTTNEKLPFSRYLSSGDWRPVGLRARGDLHALVVIANPANLADYHLAPVDVAGELKLARTSLGMITIDVLAGESDETHPSLENILASLRRTTYDLVYLVCHGALLRGEPWLWLSESQGQVRRVSGAELAQSLKELEPKKLPRLVVLASCQSAGGETSPNQTSSSFSKENGSKASENAGVRVALGPRLVEAGVPAVVAMLGQISQETVAEYMHVFFSELLKDGQIDRAMAVARGAVVHDHLDFWMPVLFMRLKDGLIWYEPSFRDQFGRKVEFNKWPTLTSSIKNGRCTAILGSGLVEPILGSHREIAQDWASAYAYPLSPHERDSLPQVAQYLGIDQDRPFLLDELGNTLRKRIQSRFGELLAGKDLPPDAPLDDLMNLVGAELRRGDPFEPHYVLANLPLKIYITTNSNSLMAGALREAGRQPVVEVLPWNEQLAEEYQDTSIFVREPGYRPSVERPLVYHLFGLFSQPESIVLTEDDHFEFLKGAARNNELIPNFVQRAMADSALLFLGYRLEDWNFRVLFRSILDQPGNRLYQYSHIAVQIMPEVGRLVSTERALRYLEEYLNKGARAEISLYLGSAEEFVRLLAEKVGLALTA
jgi:hypothetical protein